MQGKGVVKFFAILLAVVCIYQLSFTWVAHKVKNDAQLHAKGDSTKLKAYLDSISTQPVYPILKHNYQYVSQRALALGLDLEGGMSVTMQISLNDLVKRLSNNNQDVVFNQAMNAATAIVNKGTVQKSYITLFVEEYEKLNPNGKLATIFSTKDNQDHIKFNASNSEVEAYLKELASVTIQQSYTVLNTRIDGFGVANANISLQPATQRILIELPGVKDAERVRKLLSGTAKLEFYQTYDNRQVVQVLGNVNGVIAAKLKANKNDTAKTAIKPVDTKTTTAAVKADSAKAKAAAATAAAKPDTSKNKSLSLLNKVKKSGVADTSSLSKNAANNSPLFSILTPLAYQGQNGQVEYAPGPMVGTANVKDTALVNKYLHSPEAKAIIPSTMKFLWSVKPREKRKYLNCTLLN